MNLTAKAQAIERDFQNARAKANYTAFPEFARRYIKHNKDGIVLANTALLEAAVGEAELKARLAGQWTQSASLDDTPECIAQSPLIKPEAIQDAVEKLEGVLARGTEEHQEYAAIVLARAALATDASDRLQKVAHYLQNIQLPPTKIPMGYNFALVVCGLAVKGMTLEEEGRISDAIVSYDNVSLLVQSNPNERSDELNSWTEHALYRAGMLKLRQGDQTQLYPASLSLEVAQIHAYWEDALYAITSFPKAEEKNWRVLVMLEQIVEDRKLLGPCNDADKRVLVETIYRASQKTFQSPRVLRFLFFALVEMGQYDEAVLALKAYLDLAEINHKVKSSDADEALTHEQRMRKDVESNYDITTVMVAGSQLYGKELNQPGEALSCAERALKNIQLFLQDEDVSDLLFEAYKLRGIAYSLQASQVHEPENRPSLYSKALESFEKAIETAPMASDGHYHLALQLAEMKEISRATEAVKQSLNLNSAHLPSWHLLALLLSSQKDYKRALDICTVGLKESEWDLVQTDGSSASQLDGEDYLALRITQAVLHDQVHGLEAALEPQEALFVLYTKVFAPEPSSVGESVFDIQNIRRRDQSDVEINAISPPPVVGRPRAGSILSVRSKSGASDVGQGLGANNGSTLDIPKPNYASSITSIGSSGSKKKGKLIPPAAAAAAAAANAAASRSLQNLPPIVQRPTGKSVQRSARANKVLVTLWLLSASTFRRLDRMEEALKAIEEAERIDASNPDVWYQLGLLYAAQEDKETASVSYSKALALEPFHPACLVRVGRTYLEAGSLEMAESVLETTTRSQGWDSAEAWFYLGKVFEASERLTRAKECLWYALDLERSKPVRDFAEALPRYLA
ncbi:hypothetical protein BGZ70_005939 [Mortierella alpina]|uniref:TPR-like protein n=1 Tax=Mortierella alpina TaxID=64518 RepID=A0A9P6J8Z8_MORAP|nr:hypothetical protein BGZ70_005939 [Mortierella alpina]